MSTLSSLTSSYGRGETELNRVLASLGVEFMAGGPGTFVRVWSEFRKRGPVYLYPDALIDDPDFGSGVILVQGDVHRTRAHARAGGKDDRARADYASQRLWVEEIAPSEARDGAAVKALLERHRVAVDEYGGRS